MRKNYSVYKHTSPTNKVYIGISNDPIRRWRNGKGYEKNKYFYKAIQKYGWNNFKHEILFTNLTKENACKKEIELIEFYKSTQKKFGYNLSTGGECSALGVVHSKKSKQQLSEKMKGKNNPFYNHIHTEETKKKISESRKNKEWDFFKGKHHTEESKRKLRESHLGLYDNGKSVLCKKVCQYNLDGILIKTFDSLTNAAKELNVNKGWLSEIIKKNKVYKNYKFTYKGVY